MLRTGSYGKSRFSDPDSFPEAVPNHLSLPVPLSREILRLVMLDLPEDEQRELARVVGLWEVSTCIP